MGKRPAVTALGAVAIIGLIGCFPDPPHSRTNADVETLADTSSVDGAEDSAAPPDTSPSDTASSDTAPTETLDTLVADDGTGAHDDTLDTSNEPETHDATIVDEDTAEPDSAPDTSEPDVDPPACEDGVPCDDKVGCTHDDVCTDGHCAGTAYACDDGLACTIERCDGLGGCTLDVVANTCFIESACWARFQPNPGNPCLRCEEGDDWTRLTDVPCDDGNACTVGDTCVDGACTSGADIPDDLDAGDWLSYPAVTWDPVEDDFVSALQIAEVRNEITVIGAFRGRATFANGIVVDSAERTQHYIARYDLVGEMTGLHTLEGDLGRDGIRLLEQPNSSVYVAVECSDCEIVHPPSGERWPLPTTAEAPFSTIGFNGEEAGGGSSVLNQWHIATIDQASSSISVGPINDGETRVWGERTYQFLGAYRDYLVHHNIQSGVWPQGTHHFYLDRDVLPLDPPLPESPWLKLYAATRDVSGDVLVIVGCNYDVLVTDDDVDAPTHRLVTTSPSYHLVRLDKHGLVTDASLLMSELEPWVAEKSAELRLLVSDDGIFVYGHFPGPSVTVGSGPNAVEHNSNQFFNIYGGGIKGAGGEAFVAKFDDALAFQWVRFIEPIGTLPSNFRGTDWRSGRVVDGRVLLVGRIEGSVFLFDELRRVGMLASYDADDGDLESFVSHATHADSMAVPTPTYGTELYVAGTVTRYPSDPDFDEAWRVGVGPTSVPWVPPQSAFVQRINSANGLICGALGPLVTP